MTVSPKYKMLFVQVPKAGSTSISNMLTSVDSTSYQHKEAHAVLGQADADLFKDYFKFAVVRNSYKLCASFYRFMTEKISNLDERQEPSSIADLVRGQVAVTETSNDWQISQAPNPFPVQLDYFSQEGKILVDKIFIYDKGLDSELSDLKKQINFHGALERKHYYGEYDWKSYYDTESVEYVKQVCKKDIEYFGFEFNEQ